MTYDYCGNRSDYYNRMTALAREIRQRFKIAGPCVKARDLMRIFEAENIHIDPWPYPMKQLRGAYFNDEHGASVLLNKDLPDDPLIFTLGHELKHHFADRSKLIIKCMSANAREPLEIGAEVFSAELLLPDDLF